MLDSEIALGNLGCCRRLVFSEHIHEILITESCKNKLNPDLRQILLNAKDNPEIFKQTQYCVQFADALGPRKVW